MSKIAEAALVAIIVAVGVALAFSLLAGFLWAVVFAAKHVGGFGVVAVIAITMGLVFGTIFYFADDAPRPPWSGRQ